MDEKTLAFRPGNPDQSGQNKDTLAIIYNKDTAQHMIHRLEKAIELYKDSDEFYFSQMGAFFQP
jgi:hypothetical protein